MPDETPLIRMRGVTKRYGDHVVLRELDLDVTSGSHVALIGPSGSGKSTILRTLVGLERIDGGRIAIDGESVWTMTRRGRERAADHAHLRRMRRQVGMVFQQFNLFPHMTVLRNLTEAPVHARGLRAEEARELALDLLGRVGLRELADRYPGQLSGGQKQRVAIARALAMQPRIMLFDEVTSALDPETVGDVLDAIRQLAGETDMTILLVTHQMAFARRFATRVLFLEGGRILEDGPPERVLDDPQEERTRAFVRGLREAG